MIKQVRYKHVSIKIIFNTGVTSVWKHQSSLILLISTCNRNPYAKDGRVLNRVTLFYELRIWLKKLLKRRQIVHRKSNWHLLDTVYHQK